MPNQKLALAIAISPLIFISGCMNMPTPPAQITGAYTSDLKYDAYDCSRLAIEMDSLARRENELVAAQNQRIKTSETQAFWWGYGQGDGVEAAELANIRGEKDALIKTIDIKKCGQPTTATQGKPVSTVKATHN